jgi:hypothetical protein
VSQLQVWIDGVKNSQFSGGSLDTQLTVASGSHRIVVVAIDSAGVHFQQAVSITVNTTAPPPPPPPPPPSQCSLIPASPSVTICTPAQGDIVASPVHLVAGSTDSVAVSQMQVWIDGVKNSQNPGGTLDTQVALSSGSHRIVVVAIDSAGVHFQQAINVTVQ